RGHQLLPPAERHDAVAPAGAVSDAEELVSAELHAGRAPHLHLSIHRIAPAAAGGGVRRQESAPLLPGERHGVHTGGPRAARFCHSYALLLFAAALIGTGSSVFHPESSRVARMASG